MHPNLIDHWERGLDAVPFLGAESLESLATRVRGVVAAAGLEDSDLVLSRALAVAEAIGSNVRRHAVAGGSAVHRVERGGAVGIEIVGFDRGAGWKDLRSALAATGRGGATIRSLATEVDIDVRLGEGTRVAARVFGPLVSRAREVGIHGRPLPGERVSGDHAAFRRVPGALLLAVCDGLGHGPLARVASAGAIDAFLDRADASLPTIVGAMHDALRATRGAVVAIARIDDVASTIEVAVVGNVDVRLAVPGQALHRFVGNAAVVGSDPFRVRVETAPFPRDGVLVVSTDGLPSGTRIDETAGLFLDQPAVIAETLVERWAKAHDDALVLVVR